MHVGIIMDGNGRWATEQGLPRTAGHQAATDRLEELVGAARQQGVSVLTLYAFAKKNWKRDRTEVDFLWQLLSHLLQEQVSRLVESGARFRVIGDRTGIDPQLVQQIEALEVRSRRNDEYVLQIALNYDGEDEVVRAVQSLAASVQHGELQPRDIDLAQIKDALDTAGLPDPDVVIRTGVDENRAAPDGFAVWRSSSFLQLQSAQAVCISCTTRFPDFTAEHIRRAIELANPDARLFGGQRK